MLIGMASFGRSRLTSSYPEKWDGLICFILDITIFDILEASADNNNCDYF